MFKAYQHIERYDSESCEGLLYNDGIIIQSKVDSTNGSVWFDEHVRAGSRNREVTPEKDNAGFASWIYNSVADEPMCLRACVKSNPTFRIYGEYMGQNKFLGQIKDYNQYAKRHFYIFDVFDDKTQEYLHPDVWQPILASFGLEPWFVKTLAVVDRPNVDTLAEIAQNNKFLLDNANHAGEGIVIKCYNWRNKYGRQQFGKLVLDEYKQAKKVSKKTVLSPGEIEMTIVDTYCTDAEFAKSVEKVVVACGAEEFDNKNPKQVGRYINLCWSDLCENCCDWCKKFHTPIVDFSRLKGMCQAKARKYIGL